MFKQYVKHVVESILFHGSRKILLVNGHGGNASSLNSLIGEIRREKPEVSILLYEYWKNEEVIKSVFGESASLTHACGIETSLISACRSGLVDMDLAKTLEIPSVWGIQVAGQIMQGTTDEFSKLGAVGDMSLLSAEKGHQLKSVLVDHLSGIIEEFGKFDIKSI